MLEVTKTRIIYPMIAQKLHVKPLLLTRIKYCQRQIEHIHLQVTTTLMEILPVFGEMCPSGPEWCGFERKNRKREGQLISSSPDREGSLCFPISFMTVNKLQPCHCRPNKSLLNGEGTPLEIDLRAKSAIWNYHPLWLCNCIINVKKEKLVLEQNVWLMVWRGNTVLPFTRPIPLNDFLPSGGWGGGGGASWQTHQTGLHL